MGPPVIGTAIPGVTRVEYDEREWSTQDIDGCIQYYVKPESQLPTKKFVLIVTNGDQRVKYFFIKENYFAKLCNGTLQIKYVHKQLA